MIAASLMCAVDDHTDVHSLAKNFRTGCDVSIDVSPSELGSDPGADRELHAQI